MDTTEFAEHVAEVVVAEGELDRPAVEDRPYLPLRSLEGWSNTLAVLSERIKDDDARIALYLLEAGNYLQMAVWRYDQLYGDHANGPAPTNPQEKR